MILFQKLFHYIFRPATLGNVDFNLLNGQDQYLLDLVKYDHFYLHNIFLLNKQICYQISTVHD
jgi:hypothetical protein